MDGSRKAEIEERIAELERRWPAHSAPPGMWQELEQLEDELKRAQEEGSELNSEESGGRQTGPDRLP